MKERKEEMKKQTKEGTIARTKEGRKGSEGRK